MRGNDPPRRAEIQQQRPAVGKQEDVARCNVRMVAMRAMQHFDGVQQLVEKQPDTLFVGVEPTAADRVLQRYAFMEGHGHVGSAIGFPDPQYLHQRRRVEARQQACFAEETPQPHVE